MGKNHSESNPPNPIKKKKDYFNDKAKDWDKLTSHDPKKVEKILSSLNLKQGNRVLDVGTGTGFLIPHIHKLLGKVGEIVAIDISNEMIKIARRKAKKRKINNVTFKVKDAKNIDFLEEFDAVICYACFPHIESKKESLKRLVSALKKDGYLLIAHSQSREYINEMHMHSTEVVCTDYLPTVEEISEMMKKVDLEIIDAVDNSEMFYVVGKKI